MYFLTGHTVSSNTLSHQLDDLPVLLKRLHIAPITLVHILRFSDQEIEVKCISNQRSLMSSSLPIFPVQKEDLNQMNKAEEGEDEEFVRETTVGRTFAYSASVLIQIFWMVITTLLLISDNHHGSKAWWDISYLLDEQEQAVRPSIGVWEATNHATGKLIPCLLLPLLIIIPPIFRRRKHRVLITLVLCSLGLFLQALHLISSLAWALKAKNGSLKMRTPELLLKEVIAAVLAALLGFVLHTTYRAWKKGKPSNIAMDNNKVGRYFISSFQFKMLLTKSAELPPWSPCVPGSLVCSGGD